MMVYSMLTSGTTIIIWLCLTLPSVSRIKACAPRSLCSCETVDGIYDLHLLGNINGTPRFSDITEPRGLFTYSWNPCYGFNLNTCRNVSICQHDISQNLYHELGTQWSIEYLSTDDAKIFQYSADTDILRTVYIRLMCDKHEEGEITFISEDPLTYYTFELVSKYACPVSTTDRTKSKVWQASLTSAAALIPILSPLKPNYFYFEAATVFLFCIIFVFILLSLLFVMGLCMLLWRYKSTVYTAEEEDILRKYQYIKEADFVNTLLEPVS